MSTPGSDTVFAGSIPELYDTLLVPLIFAPYADDLAARVAARRPGRVLETAAGTGAVTRALARLLGPGCELIATDLNPPMLARAEIAGTARPVRWLPADAQQLPFEDASVDIVVCQFGAMFFPDRPGAFAEARRVLRRGGALLFNVWDRIEENELADTVTAALARRFPADPPRFLARTPHGHADTAALAADIARAGFAAPPRIETIAARSRAPSARIAALALCQGTLLSHEILARDPDGLGAATADCAAAIAARFGPGAVDAKMQAHVITVER